MNPWLLVISVKLLLLSCMFHKLLTVWNQSTDSIPLSFYFYLHLVFFQPTYSTSAKVDGYFSPPERNNYDVTKSFALFIGEAVV